MAFVFYLVFNRLRNLEYGDLKMECKLTLNEFWNLYFNNNFVFLKRDIDKYEGEYGDYSQANKSLIVQFPKFVQFKMSKQKMEDYDFGNDYRFSKVDLTSGILNALNSYDKSDSNIEWILKVLLAISKASPETMLLSIDNQIKFLQSDFPDPVELEIGISKYIEESIVTEQDRKLSKQNRCMDYLHPEKIFFIRAAVNAKCQFIRPHLQLISKSPFEENSVAFECTYLLSKFNEKTDIKLLLEILANSTLESRHFDASRALTYICSGQKIIAKPFEQDYLSFWINQINILPKDQMQWLHWDAESVFWEKRLWTVEFCVKNKIKLPSKVIHLLKNDEVEPVRIAAKALME
jgi:hypothetical protein